MATTDLVDIDSVKVQVGITDAEHDLWLAGAIVAVTEAIEATTGRWFTTRATTLYFDGAPDAWALPVERGVQSVTYVGIASTDQPDTGLGTYTDITTAVYLDPPAQDRRLGAPATRLTLSRTGGYQFPCAGQKRSIKATGVFGAPSARVSQIGTAAIIRAFRAKSSGGADYAIVGPDGGMKILRDFAPSELEELIHTYAVPMVG